MEAQRPIQALPDEVVSKIRSSLTIPSVADCVEELVLNSLDANATCIAVRVDLESLRVQVVDNGYGIPEESLAAVGERYSTSKCYQMEDLGNLAFFGFRGEFMSSLSRISSLLEVLTRPHAGKKTFTKLFRKGKLYELGEAEETRPAHGTTVNAYNVYYNLPVRQKKVSVVLDMERIRKCLTALAVIHYQVSFSLRDDCTGSKIIQTHSTKSSKSAFGFLFGHAKSNILREVSHTHKTFTVRGYVGVECHTNKSLQFVYVNKRPVHKTKIHKAINKYLRQSLLLRSQKHDNDSDSPDQKDLLSLRDQTSPRRAQGEYAIYILDITCLRCEYDIIPDPSKTFLEFQDWAGVTVCIEKALHKFLVKENLVLNVSETSENKEEVGRPLNEDSEDDELLEPWKQPGPVSPSNLKKLQHFGYNITTTSLSNNLQSRNVKRAHLQSDAHDTFADGSSKDAACARDRGLEKHGGKASPCDLQLSEEFPSKSGMSARGSKDSSAIGLWSSKEENECKSVGADDTVSGHISATESEGSIAEEDHMQASSGVELAAILENQVELGSDGKSATKISQSNMVKSPVESQTVGDKGSEEILIPEIMSSSVDVASDKTECLSYMLPSCASTICLKSKVNSEPTEASMPNSADYSRPGNEVRSGSEAMANECVESMTTPPSRIMRTPIKCGLVRLECDMKSSLSTNQSANTSNDDSLLPCTPGETTTNADVVTPGTRRVTWDNEMNHPQNRQGHERNPAARETCRRKESNLPVNIRQDAVQCDLSETVSKGSAQGEDAAQQDETENNLKHSLRYLSTNGCLPKTDEGKDISSLQRFRNGLKCTPSSRLSSGIVEEHELYEGHSKRGVLGKTSALSEFRSHWFPDVGLRMSRNKDNYTGSNNSKLLSCLSQKLAFLRTRQDQCNLAGVVVKPDVANPPHNGDHMKEDEVPDKSSIGCQTSPLSDDITCYKESNWKQWTGISEDTMIIQPRTPELKVIEQDAVTKTKDVPDPDQHVSPDVRDVGSKDVSASSQKMHEFGLLQRQSSHASNERMHAHAFAGIKRGCPYQVDEGACSNRKIHNFANKNLELRPKSSFLSSDSFVQSAKDVLPIRDCQNHPSTDARYMSNAKDESLMQERISKESHIQRGRDPRLAEKMTNSKEDVHRIERPQSQAGTDSSGLRTDNDIVRVCQSSFEDPPHNNLESCTGKPLKQMEEEPSVNHGTSRDRKHQELLSMIDSAFLPVNKFIGSPVQQENIPFSGYRDIDIDELSSTQPFNVQHAPKDRTIQRLTGCTSGTQPSQVSRKIITEKKPVNCTVYTNEVLVSNTEPERIPSQCSLSFAGHQAESDNDIGSNQETMPMNRISSNLIKHDDVSGLSSGDKVFQRSTTPAGLQEVNSRSVEVLDAKETVLHHKGKTFLNTVEDAECQSKFVAFNPVDSQLSQRTLDALAMVGGEDLQDLTVIEEISSRVETDRGRGQGEDTICDLMKPTEAVPQQSSNAWYEESSCQPSQETMTALKAMSDEELGKLTVIEEPVEHNILQSSGVPVKVSKVKEAPGEAQGHSHEMEFFMNEQREDRCDAQEGNNGRKEMRVGAQEIPTEDNQIALQHAGSEGSKTDSVESLPVRTSFDSELCKKGNRIDEGTKKMVTFKKPMEQSYMSSTNGVTTTEGNSSPSGGNPLKRGHSKSLPWELFWFLPKSAKDFFPCKPRGSRPQDKDEETENGTTQLIDQHLTDADQDEVAVKWKDGPPVVARGALKSVDDLFDNWQNPVFEAGDHEVLNATQALSATVKVHNRLHPYNFTKEIFSSIQVIGQLDNKFVACLVSTGADDAGKHPPHLLVLVDQHAAHERVRLEQLTQEAHQTSAEEDTQSDDSSDDDHKCCCLKSTPILPVPIHISDHESRLAHAYSDKLKRFGLAVTIKRRDRAYRAQVTALPTCLVERETNSGKRAKQSCSSDLAETLVQECVHLFQETAGSSHVLPKTITKSLNSQACRGAIKFGDALDHENMVLLLSQLSECDLPFQCAHGRPSIIPLLDLNHLHHKLHPQDSESMKPNLSRLREKIDACHLNQR